MIFHVSRMRLACSLFIISAICLMASTAKAPAANGPTPVGITAGFNGYPSCVVTGMNAKFPLLVTNHGKRTETVTVQLAYVTRLTDAGPNAVVITKGTDRLSGVRGGEFWRFRLAPGQSLTKRLVTRVQWPYENKRGPAVYSVSEQVTVAGVPGLQIWAIAQTPYCA